jgi:ABC-type uncharacterized transport system auxiliary subunit
MKKRFSVSQPVTAIEGSEVGNALNLAANEIASQVAEWVAR